ncbi:LiaF transmembrane domain-containing protein [Simiduia aestuariiviva]|uniref:LiaF transmembrane domain-containing protein n=1 Tax=Simiduia aestuariiviva TaxID=1510459 RepID=A0A839UQF4_9GAMM|nr:hypothetical protein [Simiduia aestuariiviva]MBB3167637.1 hypothetical protein [Simiduia aestuariiviva]
MSKHNDNMTPRTLFGIGLVAFAVLLFLNNIGIPFLGLVLKNWPVLLIIAGAVQLYGRREKEGTETRCRQYLPHTLIGLGVLFQLANWHILNFSISALIIPIILLIAGINLIRQKASSGPKGDSDTSTIGIVIDGELDQEQPGTTSEQPGDTKIDVFTILGGGNFSTRSKRLTGGSVIAILGGAEVDIREADSKNGAIEIDVLAFMGGAEIKVPAHFNVTVKVLPMLGGVTNKTTCLADKLGMPEKHLVITGMVLLGGLEITN